jgi:hypothetical protein
MFAAAEDSNSYCDKELLNCLEVFRFPNDLKSLVLKFYSGNKSMGKLPCNAKYLLTLL